MNEVSLLDRERDVERARAKLADDLAVLCSPETFSAFTDDLKQEALGTRDEFWEKLKARAAANPAADIAIGAGLAWRLIRRPPIASTLIGVGLYSLWKTEAKTAGDRSTFLQQSKDSLKEQAGEVFSAASDVGSRTQEAVTAKGSQVWQGAKEKMRAWGEDIGDMVGDSTSRLGSSAEAFLDDMRAKRNDLRDQVQDVAAKAIDKARDDNVRNNLLLGAAGVAVAAALGIACQKRISETLRS